jgi:hypothetical protein
VTPQGEERMEVFYQATNSAVHGRLYNNSVWTSNIFSVDGTASSLAVGASMTATTIGNNMLLAYVSSTGFLTVQSRGTTNVTQYNEFNRPKTLLEGDGSVATGIAAVDLGGEPKVYFVSERKILELSATDVGALNWTRVDTTAS